MAERLQSYQGGGILILRDSPDFSRTVPSRCREKELPWILPSQKVIGAVTSIREIRNLSRMEFLTNEIKVAKALIAGLSDAWINQYQ